MAKGTSGICVTLPFCAAYDKFQNRLFTGQARCTVQPWCSTWACSSNMLFQRCDSQSGPRRDVPKVRKNCVTRPGVAKAVDRGRHSCKNREGQVTWMSAKALARLAVPLKLTSTLVLLHASSTCTSECPIDVRESLLIWEPCDNSCGSCRVKMQTLLKAHGLCFEHSRLDGRLDGEHQGA